MALREDAIALGSSSRGLQHSPCSLLGFGTVPLENVSFDTGWERDFSSTIFAFLEASKSPGAVVHRFVLADLWLWHPGPCLKAPRWPVALDPLRGAVEGEPVKAVGLCRTTNMPCGSGLWLGPGLTGQKLRGQKRTGLWCLGGELVQVSRVKFLL